MTELLLTRSQIADIIAALNGPRFAVVRLTGRGRGWSVVGRYKLREEAQEVARRKTGGALILERIEGTWMIVE